MDIAIIGGGRVGGTLGRRWSESGHQVIFGMRDAQSDKARALVTSAPNARIMSVRDAAASASLVVLATPWAGTRDALAAAGELAGKILVDCTNPLAPDLSGLLIGHTTSAAEQIAGWAPGAQVVKAFSTTGSQNMADPRYPAGSLSMFICGDDADAKQTVAGLAADLGFAAVDAGALQSARYLEPLGMLWIHMAYGLGNGSDFGFMVVKRAAEITP